MKMKLYTIAFLLAIFAFTACENEDTYVTTDYYSAEEYATLTKALNLDNQVINYSIVLPPHAKGKPSGVSNDMALLGRVLFYDKHLSKNNTIACASCHQQELAFSDDKKFSVGFDGALTKRNSLSLGATLGFENSYENPTLINNSNKPAGFLWDERAFDIHSQARIALTDEVEMGMSSMEEVVQRVSAQPHYAVLFKRAFGLEEVQGRKILDAIETFVNTLASTHSRFDEGMNKTNDLHTDFPNFSPMENLGKRLYLANCGSCHGAQMVSLGQNVANNRLDFAYSDVGRFTFSELEQDRAVFKVPMLRNVALTAPYMHDGRFATLEEVVEHYNSGIKTHPNLHENLRDIKNPTQPKRLNLTYQEKQALVAFLHTLTDPVFISDRRFSDPFK